MAVDEGRKGVVRDAVRAAADELADRRAPEQAELFNLPTRLDGERAEIAEQKSRQQMGAGGGRPPGAQNLATREFREYLLARGRSPLVAMMQWSMHTPETLANELGCTRAEAFDRLRHLWADLAPYLHSKTRPTDDEGKAGAAGVVVEIVRYSFDEDTGEEIEDKQTIQLDASDIQRNQPLSGEAGEKSHDEKSHEAPSHGKD